VQLLQLGHITPKVVNGCTPASNQNQSARYTGVIPRHSAQKGAGDIYAPITISPAATLRFRRNRAGDFSSDFLDSEKRFR